MIPASTARWRTIKPERPRVFMWGAADQARVNAHILHELDCELVALVDDTPGKVSPIPDVPLFHGWVELEPWLRTQDATTLGFIIAIGAPYSHVRLRYHDLLTAAGFAPVSLVHQIGRASCRERV